MKINLDVPRSLESLVARALGSRPDLKAQGAQAEPYAPVLRTSRAGTLRSKQPAANPTGK